MTPTRADAAVMQAGEEPVSATWEEARPRHLPDWITARFVGAVAALAIAISQVPFLGLPDPQPGRHQERNPFFGGMIGR